MTRIIGIDPGSRITGYGIIEYVDRRVTHVAHGCIKTSQGELPERLKEIFEGVAELLVQVALVAASQASQLALLLEVLDVDEAPHVRGE